MSVDAGLYAWVQEALAPVGELTRRPMMGGAALYLDGTIFAILTRGELWFKGDAESAARWDRAGCEPFTFVRAGKTGATSYRRAPAEVHDGAEAMRDWAGIALAAGLRAAAKKTPKRAPVRS